MRPLKILLLVVAFSVFAASAGNYSSPQFADSLSSASSHLVQSTTLGVALNYWGISNVYNTQITTTNVDSGSSDVTSFGPGRFGFFWSATLAGQKAIYKREYLLTDYVANQQGGDAALYNLAQNRVLYLHADYGKNGYLASYVDNSLLSRTVVYALNGSARDSIRAGAAPVYPSQCHLSNDTFLSVYSSNNNRNIVIKKILSNAGDVSEIAGAFDTVSVDPLLGSNRLLNVSVAADTFGNIGVTWTKGSVSGLTGGDYKRSYYRFYFGVLSSRSAETLLETPAADTTTSYFYDNAPIVSYRPAKFVSASWGVTAARRNFVTLHRFWVNSNNTVDHQSDPVVLDSVARFATIAARGNYVAIAWLGSTTVARQTYIEGRRYQIVNDSLRLDLVQNLTLSDSSVAPVEDRYNSAINLALDSVGNMAVTWKKNGYYRAGLWANKPFLYDTARFESRIIPLPVQPGDSVFFNPISITNAGVGGSYEPFIQFSSDHAQTFGNWIRFRSDDAAAIRAARGRYTDFRYALSLIRSNTDSARAPILSNAQISWDIQPNFLPVDSVQISGRSATATADSASFHWMDTVSVYARSDSVRFFYHAWDSDTSADSILTTVQWRGAQYLIDTLRYAERFQGSAQFSQIAMSDTVFTVSLSGQDFIANWQAPPKSFFVKSVNYIPQLFVRAIWDSAHTGTPDTIIVGTSRMFSIQQTDSVVFEYWLVDSNDVARARASIKKNSAEESGASVNVNDTGRYVFYGASQALSRPDDLLFFGADPEDTVSKLVGIGVNHFPAITGAAIGTKPMVNNGDTVSVRLQTAFALLVSASDSDLATWDTLTYTIALLNGAGERWIDSTFGDSTLSFTPQFGDSSLRIIIHDHYNVSDTIFVFFKYPFYTTDSLAFPLGYKRRDTLANYVSLISGGGHRDTVMLPLYNSGNDTLTVVSFLLGSRPLPWFTIGIPHDTGVVWYDSLTGSDTLHNVAVAPGSILSIFCAFNPDVFAGDGVVYDTLIISTNDPIHPRDTIPLKLEFNDLPRITSLTFDFPADGPYWLAKKKAVTAKAYSFPPHAKIVISFSEPMRPDSALSAVKIFSIFDSMQTDTIAYLPIDTAWANNHTSLTIQPRYSDTSAYFKLLPPPHLFIPTDSIALMIRDVLTDQATTPSAPRGNGIDVHLLHTRIAGADTVFKLRVDSLKFHLNQVVPAAGQGNISTKQSIMLLFSGTVFPGSIDTRKINNTALTVTSRYNRGRSIPFDTVIVQGATATFVPSIKFFYGDSVFCHYRSYAARDSMGYPVDLNGNGIAGALFDSNSVADDTSWSFYIQSIAVAGVVPESISTNATIHAPITITFNHPFMPGTLDTATGYRNRSFTFTSRYGLNGPLPLKGVSFSADSLSVTFTPESTFISTDSIWCRFQGFTADYNYDNVLNLPTDTTAVTGGKQWHFFIRAEGFYTFPNPYKPGIDPRHCTMQQQPCGIWFKNLHLLKAGVHDVAIVFYDINALPLFDTRKAGIAIHFDPSMPQYQPIWKWDTKNQYGDPVSSGIYLYVIFDLQKNILKKGKLIIVR